MDNGCTYCEEDIRQYDEYLKTLKQKKASVHSNDEFTTAFSNIGCSSSYFDSTPNICRATTRIGGNTVYAWINDAFWVYFFITCTTLPWDELVCTNSRNVWYVVKKQLKNVGDAIQPSSSRVEDTSLDIRDRKTSVIKITISTTPRV